MNESTNHTNWVTIKVDIEMKPGHTYWLWEDGSITEQARPFPVGQICFVSILILIATLAAWCWWWNSKVKL